jgi:ubiquinol-cytochrome c reductase cytochrome c subunit
VKARGLVLGAIVAGTLLSSCSYFEDRTTPFRPPPVAEPAGPDRGRTIYLRDCAWCHGSRGEGTASGPDLVSGTNGAAFTDFMLSTGRMPIAVPDERIRRREPIYEPDEIDDVVDYVASLGGPGPDVPEVDPAGGDIGLGAELYQENCAACHSTTGIGGALTAGDYTEAQAELSGNSGLVAPSLRSSSPVEIAEAMLVGPGTMPVFTEETFGPDEVDAIVRYVVYLQDAEDRGGADIGKIGPVAEGAVAWIIGLGALLLLCRWIGTGATKE